MKSNSDYLKDYMRQLKADSLSLKTQATAEHILTHFLSWCDKRELAVFSVDDVFDYIDFVDTRTYTRTYTRKGVVCKCAPATVCKEKIIVKKFLSYKSRIKQCDKSQSAEKRVVWHIIAGRG